MNKLLNRSLKKLMIYAAVVLMISIPAYYLIIGQLWEYELNEHNIILTTEAGREDSYLIILTVTSLTVLFFILLLGGFILLNRRISRKLWKPFYQSLDQIRHFDLNKQESVSFDKTDIAEFEELNASLHRLISDNIATFRQQKEFADNASHELQTPLAIIQSKLDLLLQSTPLTNGQYNMIEDINTALARVGRINKNLLLLTRIENSQFMDREVINLSDLLDSTIPPFINFADDKHLTIETAIDPGVLIDGNRILMEILLNNLLTNAIRHSVSHTQLKIALSEKCLVISNKGEEPLMNERLFKRFGTASSRTPGTGLGLALVKQISDRYHWNASYAFENRYHIFSITF